MVKAKLGKATKENSSKNNNGALCGWLNWLESRPLYRPKDWGFLSGNQDTYFRFDLWLGQCFSHFLYISFSSMEVYSGEGKKSALIIDLFSWEIDFKTKPPKFTKAVATFNSWCVSQQAFERKHCWLEVKIFKIGENLAF